MLTSTYCCFNLEISLWYLCVKQRVKILHHFFNELLLCFSICSYDSRLSIYLPDTTHTDENQNIQSIIQLFVNMHFGITQKRVIKNHSLDFSIFVYIFYVFGNIQGQSQLQEKFGLISNCLFFYWVLCALLTKSFLYLFILDC